MNDESKSDYVVEANLKMQATYSYALSTTSQVPDLLHISEILYLRQTDRQPISDGSSYMTKFCFFWSVKRNQRETFRRGPGMQVPDGFPGFVMETTFGAGLVSKSTVSNQSTKKGPCTLSEKVWRTNRL